MTRFGLASRFYTFPIWAVALLFSACLTQAQNATLCDDLQSFLPSEQVICDPSTYKFGMGKADCDELGSSVSAVVRPSTTEEAALIVKYVHANQNDTFLSVRSGGHSYTCNSLVANSIHIDLRDMNSVELVENTIDSNPHPKETQLLKFGTGNTVKQLLNVASPDRYTLVHGECHSVGVGGYYLHGGVHLSAITNLYGWGNESIRELEMIAADGSILRFVEARTRTNGNTLPPRYERSPVRVWKDGAELADGVEVYQDLWTAVRKAGSSFGLVTSITTQLWQDPEPYTWTFLLRDAVSDNELLDLFMETAHENAGVSLHLFTSPFASGVRISLKNGSRFKWINRLQCIRYITKWFRRRPTLFTRLTKLRVFGSLFASVFFPPGSDLGELYSSSFAAWGLLAPLRSDDETRDTLKWLREVGTDTEFQNDCFQFIVHTDFRGQGGESHFWTELTCGPSEKWLPILRDLERETHTRVPSSFKYRNVPIDMGNVAENLEVSMRYHPNEFEMLREFKSRYDPSNVFSVFQGIDPM